MRGWRENEMSYGKLSRAQSEALKPFVREWIFDIGAGDLELSHELLRLGAVGVTAIDKEFHVQERQPNWRLDLWKWDYDSDLMSGPVTLPFVSWPVNHFSAGLMRFAAQCKSLIYLGSNTDGNACAFPLWFELLLYREVLLHVPEPTNTLIVYGPFMTSPREPLPEEYAAIHRERVLRFGEHP
jgi:hypothetical protein